MMLFGSWRSAEYLLHFLLNVDIGSVGQIGSCDIYFLFFDLNYKNAQHTYMTDHPSYAWFSGSHDTITNTEVN